MSPKELLFGSFQAAIAAADPLLIVPNHLPAPPKGRTLVVGAGKAAASMAKAVENHWPKDRPLSGLVITRYGHGLPTERIRVIEAGHPVPDEEGEKAAAEILALTRELTADDLLLVLVSGGGSSLLSLPAEGIPMTDLKAVTKSLLASGAPIQDMNVVRKHLSLIQGGRLALASKAKVVALVVSDVTGDAATHIASGPCCADPSTFQDALDILDRYDVNSPSSIEMHLQRGLQGKVAETPKPGDASLAHAENHVIATAQQSLKAALVFFQHRGVTPVILGDSVTGEAQEVGKVYAALAKQIHDYQHPFRTPVALISGGECTVTVRGSGRGGRCSEFLLSLCAELNGQPNTFAIAADTDGIDGSEDNAGAWISPDTLHRGESLGLNAKHLLARNDAYSFFEATGGLIVTGPTRTNVNDYRAIFIHA